MYLILASLKRVMQCRGHWEERDNIIYYLKSLTTRGHQSWKRKNNFLLERTILGFIFRKQNNCIIIVLKSYKHILILLISSSKFQCYLYETKKQMFLFIILFYSELTNWTIYNVFKCQLCLNYMMTSSNFVLIWGVSSKYLPETVSAASCNTRSHLSLTGTAKTRLYPYQKSYNRSLVSVSPHNPIATLGW